MGERVLTLGALNRATLRVSSCWSESGFRRRR